MCKCIIYDLLLLYTSVSICVCVQWPSEPGGMNLSVSKMVPLLRTASGFICTWQKVIVQSNRSFLHDTAHSIGSAFVSFGCRLYFTHPGLKRVPGWFTLAPITLIELHLHLPQEQVPPDTLHMPHWHTEDTSQQVWFTYFILGKRLEYFFH